MNGERVNGQRPAAAAGGWLPCLPLVPLLLPAAARGKGHDKLHQPGQNDRNGGHGEPNSFKAEKITRPGGRKDSDR